MTSILMQTAVLPSESPNEVKERPSKVLTLETLPRPIVDVEYAVRGAIVDRSEVLRRELQLRPEGKNYTELIPANIGNPHSVGQKPLSFNRQILSCLINPGLLEEDERDSICRRSPKAAQGWMDSNSGTSPTTPMSAITPTSAFASTLSPTRYEKYESLSQASTADVARFPFPEDVKIRAQRYLKAFSSFGAYSHSKGVEIFRNDIAEWFAQRDGFKCDPESIFMTDGASSAIKLILELLMSNKSHGILIPVPQYPLYSATITRLDGTAVKYYLDEEHGWLFRRQELKRAVSEARAAGVEVKAIAVINPGNPTGSLLREKEIIEVIRFCEEEGLVILADEVYQENVYCEDTKFVSFRKVVKTLNSTVELVSFHSSSKGLGGECGVRGGLLQLENISPDVVAIIYKLSCVSLCANTMGQAMLACLLNPPKPGQPSYESYQAESQGIFNSLKRKALYASQKFNEMDGVTCQPIDGAMYAFPKITIPPKAIEEAAAKGMAPDMLYCMEMLEECGVVCVPGSGFCQYPGTYHFRVTILPREDKFSAMLQSMHQFHNRFLRKYGVEVMKNPLLEVFQDPAVK